eukprot:TRINITY_DN21474_c0_g1_i1.p1 TRINITY_DN21474_c0_g1~~TRINITY_DN21474_c0_g1_i1.p1  ORF type:complete len:392 (+),score=52.35 TRINITY_DN21474_c0_g1_i1:46-1221(+)
MEDFIPFNERPAVTRNFDVEDVEGYLEHFREYGFVVVRDVVSEEDVDKTVHEMWTADTLLGQYTGLNREDPTTWQDDNWPSTYNGFLDSINQREEQMCWENRQNPRLVKVFQNILGDQKLWVSGDRYGILRPTKGIKFGNETDENGQTKDCLQDKPEWRTQDRWLHWDQNPWSQPGFAGVQGILSLCEHTPDTGGFACIPQFQQRFKEWSENNPEGSIADCKSTTNPFVIPLTDAMQKEPVPIIQPKGSLLVWDSRLPHQNYPNSSDKFRIVQYITFKLATKDDALEKQQKLRQSVRAGIGVGKFPGCLTELGKLITGWNVWDGLGVEGESEEGPEDTISPEEMERRKRAIELWVQGEKVEADGDLMGGVEYYRRATKLYPDVESAVATSL